MGRVKETIEAAKVLETSKYLSAIASGNIKEETLNKKAEANTINDTEKTVSLNDFQL